MFLDIFLVLLFPLFFCSALLHILCPRGIPRESPQQLGREPLPEPEDEEEDIDQLEDEQPLTEMDEETHMEYGQPEQVGQEQPRPVYEQLEVLDQETPRMELVEWSANRLQVMEQGPPRNELLEWPTYRAPSRPHMLEQGPPRIGLTEWAASQPLVLNDATREWGYLNRAYAQRRGNNSRRLMFQPLTPRYP